MDAKLQGIEVDAMLIRDDELAIEHAARWQLRLRGEKQFREVAIQRFFVAALNEEIVASRKPRYVSHPTSAVRSVESRQMR